MVVRGESTLAKTYEIEDQNLSWLLRMSVISPAGRAKRLSRTTGYVGEPRVTGSWNSGGHMNTLGGEDW